jgi:hypothetical protein
MAKLNKKSPPSMHKETISPTEVEAIVRQDLKDRTRDYLTAPDNYLSNEVDFLEQYIEQWRRGLQHAEEAHLRIYHSFEKPSIFRQERDVFRLRIKVAGERLAELTRPTAGAAGDIKGTTEELVLSYAAIAIISIYKDLPCIYKVDALKRLEEYSPGKKDFKALITKYKDLKDGGITKNCDNANVRRYRIKDLESAIRLLTGTEKALAEQDLGKIPQK